MLSRSFLMGKENCDLLTPDLLRFFPKKKFTGPRESLEDIMTHENIRIAVVDDDNEMRSMLEDYLRAKNFEVVAYTNAIDALEKMRVPLLPDLIISDIRMPRMDGLEFTQRAKEICPDAPILLITAFASVETAIEAIRKGAFDYITKPFKLAALEVVIERAINFQRLKKENKILKTEVGKKTSGIESLIGKSTAMKEIFDVIQRVAPSSANLLISGESGTGKVLVARSVHNLSPRAKHPFISVNCSSLPSTILETELFGSARGAANGAQVAKRGLLEEAEGGTLLLEEIGDMDLALQSKFLKAIQDKKFKPVGTQSPSDERGFDVRILASTSKDIRQSIKNDTFREDLYYRLAVVPINVPPLRYRSEDIPLLASHFLEKYCLTNSVPIKRLSIESNSRLMGLPWHGNVRELESVIERLVVMTKADQIEVSDISLTDQSGSERFYGKAVEDNPTLEILEKRYIQYILNKTGGKKEKAAQILGINRRTLYRKEREYGFVEGDSDEQME